MSLKLDLFYLRKAFFEYSKGWRYLHNRYWLARKICRVQKPFVAKGKYFPDLSIHILTCHRDNLIALWSLCSFFANSDFFGDLYIHDDGTLRGWEKRLYKEFFPEAKIINSDMFLAEYGTKFQNNMVLKNFRAKYHHYFSFKKLIDPIFVSGKPLRLILDSDILWFRNPAEIEEQIAAGGKISLMQHNPIEIEGVSYNAGIIFYSIQNFDLKKLVGFLEKIDVSRKQSLHFADQTGYAHALRNLEALPADRYRIKGAVSTNTVARHYTSPKRPLFFIEGLEILNERILK
ncbi:MAG: hypothetical protein Q8R08_01255 [bacterium]|nr:hypothetical protein [bacterium]